MGHRLARRPLLPRARYDNLFAHAANRHRRKRARVDMGGASDESCSRIDTVDASVKAFSIYDRARLRPDFLRVDGAHLGRVDGRGSQ
jgi:hypothetical protein